MCSILQWLVIKALQISSFLDKRYGRGRHWKLWLSLGCYADPSIMVGWT